MTAPKEWRLITSGRGTAGWNMALDEALLGSFEEGDRPILRLYGWEPSLSLGRFSNLASSVDLAALEAKRLPFVRRMTGGGILVHGDDLSYSLVLPRNLLESRGVKESYRHLCGFLINLYEKLGHRPAFAGELAMESGPANLCLAGSEPYDILIEGRKMGGNAQRYTSKALFQHGTIPRSIDEERYEGLFLEASGLERAATLQRLETPLEQEALQLLLLEAFCESFGADLSEEGLRKEEQKRAELLLALKYSQQRWNSHARDIQA